MPKSAQHLTNFAHLNCVPLSIRTLLDTSNLYMILCRNLIAASWVIFTTGMASIHLLNVSTPMNKYLNPPGALGKIPTMSISQTAKGQGYIYYWHGFHSLIERVNPDEQISEPTWCPGQDFHDVNFLDCKGLRDIDRPKRVAMLRRLLLKELTISALLYDFHSIILCCGSIKSMHERFPDDRAP
jgi:hypothetical protein